MLRVRAHIASKASHGRDALLREIAVIEKDCELSEADSMYDDRPRVRRPREHDGSGDMPTELDAASHVEHATA